MELMLSNFQALGAKINIKVQYLFNHLDQFAENLGDLSKEKGKRFRQDIKTMEESNMVDGLHDVRLLLASFA